jgi:hypothetical protein
VPYLHDRVDAWEQQPDGRYRRVDPVDPVGPGAQAALMHRY